MTQIAILYPGEMGMAVGAALLCAGHQVTTCVADRSARTRDRAVAAGFRLADGLPAAVTGADAVISLVPPAAALDTARGFAAAVAAGRAAPPLFIDANSVSPTTMTAVAAVIAAAGARCVDGAVLGPADRLTGGGTIMLSGPDADAVAEMLGAAIPVRIVGAAIGDASAIKMCFAGFNKGLVALFIEMVSAAGRIGQADHLLGLLRAFYPASVETIERLQFRPALTAKTLAQGQRATLAVAIPTFTTPFHNELLKGVRFRLREYDVDLLLYDLGSVSPGRELMQFLKRGAVDGLLLAGVPFNDAIAQELQAWKSPVVLVGTSHPAFDSFYWDDVAGSRSAVKHLIDQGHRRIGMIRSQSSSLLQDRRIEGYRAALEAAGIPFDEDVVVGGRTAKHAGFSEEAGHEAMEFLLEEHPGVTAVFASSDVQAIGACKAIRDADKKVPEDVAVVGYDDIKTSQFIGLSSVDQDMHDVGQEAADRLVRRLEGKETGAPITKMMKPVLNVRGSSRFIRQ